MANYRARALVFVDESKARGYFLVATVVAQNHRATVEKSLRRLVRPGQERIHFKSESASAKRKLLSSMRTLPVEVNIYVVRARSDKESRTLCLEALVADLARCRVSRLVLEKDESLEEADRRTIAAKLKASGGYFAYLHAGPKQHPSLWVSDAVAWCHQAGGDWIRLAAPLVAETTTLG
jgi:hypothetical protein